MFGFTKTSKSGGYTLIELAVVMIVVGLIITPLMTLYNNNKKKEILDTQTVHMNEVLRTLGEYRVMYGHYPCPASLTAAPGTAEYGHESDCTDTSIAPGGCAGGLCVKNSVRTVTLVDGSTITPRVRIGAVPFRALGLDDTSSYDGYSARMVYAVTEILTDKASFNAAAGGVDIVDGQAVAKTILPVAGSGHFVLISMGPNKAGAYSRDGVLQNDCPGNTTLENLNCSTDGDAIFRATAYSEANNENHFDDTVQYFARTDVSPWELVPDGPGGPMIHATLLATGGVGVKVAADSNFTEAVIIQGDARARDGAKAQSYCVDGNITASGCMSPTLIAGDPAMGGGMVCPIGQYMVGVRNGQVECVDEIVQKCPAGEVMTGVNADRTIKCEKDKTCQSETVTTICNEEKTLPKASNGATYTIYSGANYSRKYTCKDGSWIPNNAGTGECTCQTATETRENRACGTGFETGNTYTQTRNKICPAGTWTSWSPSSGNGAATCTCVNTSQRRTVSCPANYTGTHIQERSWTCTGANTGQWGSWATVSNTCACEDKTEGPTGISCPSGYTGSIQRKRTFSCASNSWSAWEDVSNTCVCKPAAETKTGACPAGYEGSVKLTRSFLCPSATWSDWTEVPGSNTCTLIPPVVCTWVAPPGGGVTESTRRGSTVGATCDCGGSGSCNRSAGGGMYTNYSGCNCK